MIEFTQAEKDLLVSKIKAYFSEKLDQEIGQFDAEFLLDFFSEEVGSYYYNRGLFDAQTVVQEKLESIQDALYAIEKATDFKK